MKKKKQILIIIIVSILLTFLAYRLIIHSQEKSQNSYILEHYIFDKNFSTDQNKRNMSNDRNFHDGLITAKTLELFKFLGNEYPVQSINERAEHYNKVRRYLNTRFREKEATKLFEIYRKYLDCEIQLANDRQYQASSSDPVKIIILLHKAHNLRREKLGDKTADALFGQDVKAMEYFYRKAMITGDQNLYGKEKEGRLLKLKSDMWANTAEMPIDDSNPYNRYQLKIQLYHKDLAMLDESGRQYKMDEFRKEFFSEDQIKKLREVDSRLAGERENLERYRLNEQKILDSKNMAQDEKTKKIKSLQDQFFGKEAEAFQRREAMRKALEK